MVPCVERSLRQKLRILLSLGLIFPKFVTGNLFDDELIVGLVVVEGAVGESDISTYWSARSHWRSRRIRVTGHAEPMLGRAFP